MLEVDLSKIDLLFVLILRVFITSSTNTAFIFFSRLRFLNSRRGKRILRYMASFHNFQALQIQNQREITHILYLYLHMKITDSVKCQKLELNPFPSCCWDVFLEQGSHHRYHISRSRSDGIFVRNILRICRRRPWYDWKSCVKYAAVYYTAVRIGGKSHYLKTPEHHCSYAWVSRCMY